MSSDSGLKTNITPSYYQSFTEGIGNYVKVQLSEPVIMKIGGAATLGGLTLRAEKTTDMVKGTSKQGIKIIPNSSTGVGKIVGGKVGIGTADFLIYVDVDEIPTILATIEKMKKLATGTPESYTKYSYTCRGGFEFNCSYIIASKKNEKGLWMGSITGTGDMPMIEFFDEMTRAFTEVKGLFAQFK